MFDPPFLVNYFYSISPPPPRELKNDNSLIRLSSKELCDLLLYGHPDFTLVTNRAIVEATINFIKCSWCFKKQNEVLKCK